MPFPDTPNSYHDGFWQFVMDYLPNYSTRDDVLRDDILLRYLEGDEVAEDDRRWITEEFDNDEQRIREELIRLETQFANEALRAYYNFL